MSLFVNSTNTDNFLDRGCTDFFTNKTTIGIVDGSVFEMSHSLDTLNTKKRFSTLVKILSLLFGLAVIANITDSNGKLHTYVVKKDSFNNYFSNNQKVNVGGSLFYRNITSLSA